MNKKSLRINKGKMGFTLMETLIVVAILCILFGIGMANLLKTQKELRQRELDSKAEIIYVAAQNRLSELRAAGYDELYTPADTNGTVKLENIPADAQYDATDASRPVLYSVSSEDREDRTMAAANILPETFVDRELWSNHWIIEYSPATGSVYGVFYSASPLTELKENEANRNLMRYKQNRLEDGARVGYYGGDVTLQNFSKTLHPSIKIDNGETLSATFLCNDPIGTGMVFVIQVEDMVTGDSYTKTIHSGDMKPESVSAEGGYILKYTWVMDKLQNGMHFAQQVHFKGGNYIKISMQAYNENDLTMRSDAEPRYTNGLFGDPDLNPNYSKKNPGTDTAYIQCVRHLQNLDATTIKVDNVDTVPVVDTITKAVIVKDLSFRHNPDADDNHCYHCVYNTDTFTPIDNKNLRSITGRYTDRSGNTSQSRIDAMRIVNTDPRKPAGLFANFYGTEISYIRLSAVKIESVGLVGGLVGNVSGTERLTISNSWLYLDDVDGDLSAAVKAAVPEEVTPWITGSVAGGLVGTVPGSARVTIENSMASTAIRGKRYAGGLVGTVQGSLTVENCYADSYLTGANTGGILGGSIPSATINLNHFYTAGFQIASEKMGGVTPFYVSSAKDGYAAVKYIRLEDGTQLYTTLSNQSNAQVQKLYYLFTDYTDPIDYAGTESFGGKALKDGSLLRNLSGSFSTFAPNTTAYNLVSGMGLTNYSYPALKGMDHYGDWVTVQDGESLVYFEQYEGGDYAFSGSLGSNLHSSGVNGENFGTNCAIYDGYALVFAGESPSTGWTKTVTFENGNVYTAQVIESDGTKLLQYTDANGNNSYEDISISTLGGVNYYLLPLPKQEMNSAAMDGGFYQTLRLSDSGDSSTTVEDVYYYNPCFAKSAIQADAKPAAAPTTISIRTPRHLYKLANLYNGNFVDQTSKSTFYQELDLDYGKFNWSRYPNWDEAPAQSPVGTGSVPFRTAYNGAYHSIVDMNIQGSTMELGLFGQIGAKGSLRNLFLLGTREKDSYNTVTGGRNNSYSGSANSPYMGALAGINEGSIENCAVTGYALEARGFQNSVLTVGGLVGLNRGYIVQCSSDVPSMRIVSNNAASAYAGGFVGRNDGTVNNSYSVGILQVSSALGSRKTVLAGFAAANTSMLSGCYSAVALFPRDGAEAYGFCPRGSVINDCTYLDGVSLQYGDTLCLLNASQNSFAANAGGSPVTYDKLRMTGEQLSPVHPQNDPGTYYTFPLRCTLSDGTQLHIGNWLYAKSLGTLGVFYWEYEATGSNIGYHLSYQGTNEGMVFSGSNLCVAHGDDGTITRYGYGYFYAGETAPTLTADSNVIHMGTPKDEVAQELQKQMPQYTFVAYETGNHENAEQESYMHLVSAEPNAQWTLKYGDFTYLYSVSPFFGNAYSLDQYSYLDSAGTDGAAYKDQKTENPMPGSNGNSYEIRSVAQLQFINWNYGALSTDWSIRKNNYKDSAANKYTYLTYSAPNNVPKTVKQFVFDQSHDVDSYLENGGLVNFTPIGSMHDTQGVNSEVCNPYMNYFSSDYTGNDYVIKNISITSGNRLVGVFGLTVGAGMRNIVLYSDRGSVIKATDTDDWYSLGGLVGFAGAGVDPDKQGQTDNRKDTGVFANCTVSGYTIIASHSKELGWGGGNVGGLVGSTNMNITNCTAVTDIDIQDTINKSYQNIRVGQIVGVCHSTISGCYAGGSIKATNGKSSNGFSSGTSIWMGGLVGGVILREGGTLGSQIGTVTMPVKVVNCYSYVEMPSAGSNMIQSTMPIASNGEMLANFTVKTNVAIDIINSYCLASNATATDNYAFFSGKDSDFWNSTQNLNRKDTASNRAVRITNDGRSPYLSYEEMKTVLLGYLNDPQNDTARQYLAPFTTVTVTENGDPVDGKYSFPGNDTELTNLNYPFPTILTQTNAYYGNTVSVHYGRWPKFGLYWDQNLETIDILKNWQTDATAQQMLGGEETTGVQAATENGNAGENGQENSSNTLPEGAALSQRILKVYSLTGFDNQNTEVKFAYTKDDGSELKPEDSPAVVKTYAPNGGNYTVTLQAQKPGTVVVTATVEHGGTTYGASLTVTVTAELRLEIGDGSTLTLYEGDSLEVPLTISDNPYVGLDSEDMTLTVSVMTQQTLPPATASVAKKEGGSTVVKIDGLNSGRATVTVQASFHPDWADTPIQANGSINVEVWPSIRLGISDGTDFVSAPVKHTILNRRNTDGTQAETGPKLEGQELYLYTTNDTHAQQNYAGLDTLALQGLELTMDGQTFTPTLFKEENGSLVYQVPGGENGQALYQITLGPITAGDGFQWRSVSVTDGTGNRVDEEWTIRFSFQRTEEESTETFGLIFRRANLLRFYSGTSAEEPGELLETIRLPQGEKVERNQRELDQALAGKMTTKQENRGTHWSWPLPTEDIHENQSLYRQDKSNSYTVSFDGNFSGWDAGGITMGDPELTFDQTTATPIPTCAYVREGYTFLGWALSKDSADPDFTAGTDTDLNASLKDYETIDGKQLPLNDGDEITLYAIWRENTLTLTLNPGDGNPTTEVFTYSQVASAKAIPSAPAGTRKGLTFDGWSVTEEGARTYEVGASIPADLSTESKAMTLYACWTVNKATIVIHDTDGAGMVQTVQQNYTQGESITLQLPNLTRDGYTLLGYATEEGGAVTKHAGETIIYQEVDLESASQTTELWARWQENTLTLKLYSGLTVTNSLNNEVDTQGMEGNDSPAEYIQEEDEILKLEDADVSPMQEEPVVQTFGYEQVLNGEAIPSTSTQTRTGYTFTGWAEEPGGSLICEAGEPLTLPEGLKIGDFIWELYGVWEANIGTVTLHGPEGDTQLTCSYEDSSHSVTLTKPTRDGYDFQGWAETEDAEPKYQADQELDLGTLETGSVELELWPVWQEQPKEQAASENVDQLENQEGAEAQEIPEPQKEAEAEVTSEIQQLPDALPVAPETQMEDANKESE